MDSKTKLTLKQKEALKLIKSMTLQINDYCNQVVDGQTQADLIVTTVDLLAGQIRDLTKSL